MIELAVACCVTPRKPEDDLPADQLLAGMLRDAGCCQTAKALTASETEQLKEHRNSTQCRQKLL